MIYKPDYTIEIDGAEIHFLFTSLMFKKFCEKKGIELDDLLLIVSKSLTQKEKQTPEMKAAKDLKTGDYADILLAAHETYCIYHKIKFTATEADAYAWIDHLGGIVGSAIKRADIFKIFIAKLLNIDMNLLEVTTQTKGEQAEKNVEAPALTGSPGESSTSLLPQQD